MKHHRPLDPRQGSTALPKGIPFPRLYDFILRLLTRGREAGYRDRILDLAAPRPGEAVLDIGCGTGTQAIAAWQRVLPAGSVAGIDVSANMIAQAVAKSDRAGADILFGQAEAGQLPFRDGQFDLVTITTVLHMIAPERIPTCLAEAAAVLKPGGRLLLIDYAGPIEARRHWSARHGPHGRFDLHTWRDDLPRHGFADIEGGPLGWLSLHWLRARRA